MDINGNKNNLSNRMKRYEESYDFKLSPRTYILVRIDGKNFSKFTSKFTKPFDKQFSEAMDETTKFLCEKLHPKFAYTQSDEISLLFTDFENINEEFMFDGKVQKIVSISASMAAAKFNEVLSKLMPNNTNLAFFDARIFIIPDFREVFNYFVWRQQDATRNSISMAGHAELGPSAIFKKNTSEIQELLFEKKNINWNDYPEKFKRGVVIRKQIVLKPVTLPNGEYKEIERKRWLTTETPIFTQDREFLYNLIPVISLTATVEK